MGSQSDFDLFVVGAGSGGLAAAKRAASYGARVMIAEDSRVGGTCVIRGCVPKKLMVYASQLGAARQLATDFGWAPAPAEFSWQRLCQVRDQVVNNLELAHHRLLAQAQVQTIEGHATLVSSHSVAVAGKTYTTQHVLLAMGATPTMPTMPGVEHCINSDVFFELKEMPKSAVVMGGGYIGVEFACMLQGLGCKTTLLVRSQLLREFDHDLRSGMADAMRRQGIDLREGAQVERIDRKGHTLVACMAQGEQEDTIEAEACILFAIGRTPRTAGLGLREAGVQLTDGGAVCVDEHHTTAVPNVHAVGDVLDRANLTPVAIRAGRTWADRIFGGKDVTMSYDNIPTAVFGMPPIGAVGLTERQARVALGDQVKIFKTRFIPLLFSGTPQERKGSSTMKLVVDGASDRLLGAHMLGDDAPEIIQGFAAAITAGITKTQLDATMAVHPTQAEEFVLMR